MSEKVQIKGSSMRDSFWDVVYRLAKGDRDIIIVSADQNSPFLDAHFRTELPSQFLNVGIAESNAILIAAGLALEGKKVFAYAIAPFITLRCYEQIKMQLSAMNIPVTVVGVGAGFSYEDSGPTHHTLEDISIMRVLPNMTVYSVSDSVMASALARKSCTATGPSYIRLDRQDLPVVYKAGDDFSVGFSILKGGTELVIVATGSMVHTALLISENMKGHGIDAGVIDLYTLPINEGAFVNAIGNAIKIVTLEEHFLPGGMGSAVAEVLADYGKPIPIKRIGAAPQKGYCYRYGGRENIRSFYRLDNESVFETIVNFV